VISNSPGEPPPTVILDALPHDWPRFTGLTRAGATPNGDLGRAAATERRGERRTDRGTRRGHKPSKFGYLKSRTATRRDLDVVPGPQGHLPVMERSKIAENATPACSLRRKLHANVAFLAILTWSPGDGRHKPPYGHQT